MCTPTCSPDLITGNTITRMTRTWWMPQSSLRRRFTRRPSIVSLGACPDLGRSTCTHEEAMYTSQPYNEDIPSNWIDLWDFFCECNQISQHTYTSEYLAFCISLMEIKNTMHNIYILKLPQIDRHTINIYMGFI